jgi:hypothetical protein
LRAEKPIDREHEVVQGEPLNRRPLIVHEAHGIEGDIDAAGLVRNCRSVSVYASWSSACS